MPELDIIMNAEGMLKGKDLRYHITDGPLKVGALPSGMTSGRASVAIAFELPTTQWVLVETSLRMFQIAAKAFAAKYGWQDDNDPKKEVWFQVRQIISAGKQHGYSAEDILQMLQVKASENLEGKTS